MKQPLRLTAAENNAAERLDKFLTANCPEWSRTQVQAGLKAGQLTVNGRPARPGLRLKAGDIVEGGLPVSGPSKGRPAPEAIPLTILYEDKGLAAVNKPPGLVVHPGAGRRSGTLVNALLHHYGKTLSGLGGVERPGIVHRLDMETSGVLLVAKQNRIHRELSALFKERQIKKTYRTLVWGEMSGEGEINRPIGRCPSARSKMRVDPEGRSAVSLWDVKRSNGWVTEIVVRPQTGRTHQIRVHLASIGHPVVGDTVYGGGKEWVQRVQPLHRARAMELMMQVKRLMLHAESLEFQNPLTRKNMNLKAPVPADMKQVLSGLFKSKRQG